MRTIGASHELLPKGLEPENLSIGAGCASISVGSGDATSRCPVCGCGSSRVHGRYLRTVSDLPWHGVSVTLKVHARRFFCDEASCERKIFCERLPVISARARKTGRLEDALLAIAFELGGRAGARLAAELGLLAGRDALLRRIKNTGIAGVDEVKALGVDDFAFRKAHTYGTILVDLERRKVVDLLPERSQESLVTWLKERPEVEIATRDRSNIYRGGLAKGAPDAVQVTDRWHLLHNLALVLENLLLQKQPVLRRAASPEAAEEKGEDTFAPGPMSPNRPRKHEAKMEEVARKRHERLVEQWKDIHPPSVPGRSRPQRHLPPARHKRQDRLQVQGPDGAAATPGVQEEGERPRPLRALPGEALERGLPQPHTSLPRDSGAGLRQRRGDLRPLHRAAPSGRGSREAALVRAPREEGLRGGALSHLQERGGAVHAPRGEAERGAEGVPEEAVRRRRGPRRHASADPGVRRHGQGARRREARRVARRSPGVQGPRDGALRRRSEEGPRCGEGGAHAEMEQRTRGRLRA